MKKRVGFTLVELLAVIAMLAILVIIALPNVMRMFNDAKKSTFISEAKIIHKQVSSDYVKDSFNTSGYKYYCQIEDIKTDFTIEGEPKLDICEKLDLTTTKNYYAEVSSNGVILYIVVYDGSFYYVAYGEDADNIKNINEDNVHEIKEGETPEPIIPDDPIYPQDTFIITYDANGGENAPNSQTKDKDKDITLSDIIPTRNGYIFEGWNSKSDGSGLDYQSGSTYSNNESITLYAKWKDSVKPRVKITAYNYDENRENKVGTNIILDEQTFIENGEYIVSSEWLNNGITFKIETEDDETGIDSIKWSWNKSGSISDTGNEYTSSSTYKEHMAIKYPYFVANGYRKGQWDVTDKNNNKIIITIIAKIDSISPAAYYTASSNQALLKCEDNLELSGYYFGTKSLLLDSDYNKTNGTIKEWNSNINSSGTYYVFCKDQAGNVSGSSSKEYYTVSYDANGGTNAPNQQLKLNGANLTLSNETPIRSGYTFKGWNTKRDGSGTDYLKGSLYSENETIVLYAQWKDIAKPSVKITTYNYDSTKNNKVGSKIVKSLQTFSDNKTLIVSDNWLDNGVTFKLEIEDIGSGIKNVEFKWNKQGVYTDSGETYNGSTTYSSPFDTIYTSVSSAGYRRCEWIITDNENNILTIKVIVKIDSTKPTSTFNISSSEATLKCEDNVGLSGYYFGTSNNPSSSDYTTINATSKSWTSGVTAGKTYYVFCKDQAGNISNINSKGNYIVSYDANGGNGAPNSQTKIHGINLTLSNTVPTRIGYTFTGWNTKKDESGKNYSKGETYSTNANVTLYAKWTYSVACYKSIGAVVCRKSPDNSSSLVIQYDNQYFNTDYEVTGPYKYTNGTTKTVKWRHAMRYDCYVPEEYINKLTNGECPSGGSDGGEGLCGQCFSNSDCGRGTCSGTCYSGTTGKSYSCCVIDGRQCN